MADYMLFVNGAPFFNETLNTKSGNDAVISTLLSVHECAAYEITVLAFNLCGESPNTSTTLHPETRHTLPSFLCDDFIRLSGTDNNICKL